MNGLLPREQNSDHQITCTYIGSFTLLLMLPLVSKADRSGHCGNNSHPRDK